MNGKTEGTGRIQGDVELDKLLDDACDSLQRLREVPIPIKTQSLGSCGHGVIAQPQSLLSPIAEQALVNIGDGMRAIATFLGGSTLPQVVESAALLGAMGQVIGGLTSNAGRQGLDARAINQDSIDATHKIISLFDKLKGTLEAKKNGEFQEHVDPEERFKQWVKEQEDAGRPNKVNI